MRGEPNYLISPQEAGDFLQKHMTVQEMRNMGVDGLAEHLEGLIDL